METDIVEVKVILFSRSIVHFIYMNHLAINPVKVFLENTTFPWNWRPSLAYDGTNNFVWSESRDEIQCLSIGISEPLHIIQKKYDPHQFIYNDGSKCDRVGCVMVCDRQYMIERLPDVAYI